MVPMPRADRIYLMLHTIAPLVPQLPVASGGSCHAPLIKWAYAMRSDHVGSAITAFGRQGRGPMHRNLRFAVAYHL